MRECPQGRGDTSVRSNQIPRYTPIAAPPVRTVPSQTPQSGGRGRGSGGRGSSSAGRGQARVFALSQQDAQASNAVVTGTLNVAQELS